MPGIWERTSDYAHSIREGAGTSSWRLLDDSVKEQVFYRNVGEASDSDKQPAECGSVLGRKAALLVFTKTQS